MKVTIARVEVCLPDYFGGDSRPFVTLCPREEGYTSTELRKAILSEFSQGQVGGSDPMTGDYIHDEKDRKRADEFYGKALPACLNRDIKYRGRKFRSKEYGLEDDDDDTFPLIHVVFSVEEKVDVEESGTVLRKDGAVYYKAPLYDSVFSQIDRRIGFDRYGYLIAEGERISALDFVRRIRKAHTRIPKQSIRICRAILLIQYTRKPKYLGGETLQTKPKKVLVCNSRTGELIIPAEEYASFLYEVEGKKYRFLVTKCGPDEPYAVTHKLSGKCVVSIKPLDLVQASNNYEEAGIRALERAITLHTAAHVAKVLRAAEDASRK